MGQIGDFDAEQHKPLESYDPLPPGWYPAMIVASSVEKTKAGDGYYAKFEFEVVGGEYQGRKVFTNINLANPNPKAVEIGQRELSSLCRAVSKLRISDTEELHNLPLQIKVKIRPAQGDYAAANEVNGYKPLSESAQPAAAAAAPSAPAAAVAPRAAVTAPPAASKAPPWKR